MCNLGWGFEFGSEAIKSMISTENMIKNTYNGTRIISIA